MRKGRKAYIKDPDVLEQETMTRKGQTRREKEETYG